MNQPKKYCLELEVIKQIFKEHKGCYGYRRITNEINNRGYQINHKTVLKLMNENNIKCLIRKKRKYSSYQGKVGKIAPNLLNRNFKAVKPNEKWVTDVTEFALCSKKVYLSPILDLFNGEIISYNISLSPNFYQINDMLDKAFKKTLNTEGILFHSDQGWQYQMKRYQHRLRKKGILQSMSRKGNCLDNAIMENFFGILKTEMFYGRDFKNIDQFIQELNEYIDYYNNKRIKYKLKGLSPAQYRIQSLSAT